MQSLRLKSIPRRTDLTQGELSRGGGLAATQSIGKNAAPASALCCKPRGWWGNAAHPCFRADTAFCMAQVRMEKAPPCSSASLDTSSRCSCLICLSLSNLSRFQSPSWLGERSSTVLQHKDLDCGLSSQCCWRNHI